MITSEIILIATILVIGLVTGLSTVRNAVMQELGDVGTAVGVVSQDYSFGAASGHASSAGGSRYIDQVDSCEDPICSDDCIDICLPPLEE